MKLHNTYMCEIVDVLSMKSVKVTRHTRKMIEEYSKDGEKLDDTIQRLLESTTPLEIEDRSVTNMTISESTIENLKRYKAYPTQSHSDTLMELLKQVL